MRTYVRKEKSLNFSENDNFAAPDAADVSKYTIAIGQFFKKKRSKINLSLRDVAKEVNISNSTLSRYETSAIDMPVSALIRLCRFYGCRIVECVADADGMIAAENLEVLAQKASRSKKDRLLKERKTRPKYKESGTAERLEMEYVCDIAGVGVQILDKIGEMDIPAKYRNIIEQELSNRVLELVNARSRGNTRKRLATYTKALKKYLPQVPESGKIKL